jgi:hypothetical protein
MRILFSAIDQVVPGSDGGSVHTQSVADPSSCTGMQNNSRVDMKTYTKAVTIYDKATGYNHDNGNIAFGDITEAPAKRQERLKKQRNWDKTHKK